MSSELTAPSTATLRRQLGKEGLFRLGVPRSLGGHGGTKEDVVRAVAVVAKRHPKSGVLLASQRLLIEVLLQAENIGSGLDEKLLDQTDPQADRVDIPGSDTELQGSESGGEGREGLIMSRKQRQGANESARPFLAGRSRGCVAGRGRQRRQVPRAKNAAPQGREPHVTCMWKAVALNSRGGRAARTSPHAPSGLSAGRTQANSIT